MTVSNHYRAIRRRLLCFVKKHTIVTIDKPSRAIVLTFDSWDIPAYERGLQIVCQNDVNFVVIGIPLAANHKARYINYVRINLMGKYVSRERP